MTLADHHRAYLRSAAITDVVIDASGITSRTEEPQGIVFPWWDGNGTKIPQLRPDNPKPDADGRLIKYRFPKGSTMILNQLRDSGEGPAIICEGTKQQYSALSYAPEEYAVYGLAGCWCWTDADLTWVMGRPVYVIFDGDLSTNKDVHQAAAELRDALELNGASEVRFVRTPARGTDGLDDVLSRVPEDKRATYVRLWLDKALPKLPKTPSQKDTNPFFDKGGLQVQKATEFLLEKQPAALTAERKIALYLGGSYHIDGTAFLSAVSRQLGDQFRPAWRGAMEEMAVGILFQGGKLLPERSPFTLLNVRNGMLDLRTLELKDHSPEYLSTVQVPVEWDPHAKAPVYETWLAASCPGQVDDIEEVAGTMLDPTRTPHKAAFLFGPSRSGKSTWLRLMQAIAGVENRTSVTLHDLSRDRFAAANVYGKMLNAAADLSSAHVEDLSVFKMMTGEDAIHGNRKYGAQFTFTNQALFAFSANELPTVSESSRAYAERIKPFEFPHSFAGKEDPELEPRMMQELPGILVRWVNAYRRLLSRGGYLETDARVRKEFETRSDRVAQWVSDVCVITTASHGQNLPEHQATGRRESARAFNAWAERNGGHPMGERKIFDRLGQIPGVVEVRAGRNRTRAFNIVIKDDPNSDLGFSPEPSRERAEVRADRAVSEHPAHTPTSLPPLRPSDDQGSEVESYGQGALKVPTLPVSARTFGSGARSSVVLGFDIETASAQELFTGKHEGSFVRLVGAIQDDPSGGESVTLADDTATLFEDLNRADVIYGHNILGFDLLALARHCGADYDALAAKAVDTLVLARLADPPGAKGMKPWSAKGYYSLDQVAKRLGHAGKSDDLKALADEFGGYDRIPTDDARYRDYLRGDLEATRHVYETLPDVDDYARREMRIVALQNRMTLNGWAVDEELLAERVAHEEEQRQAAVAVLHEKYGMPVAKISYKLKLKRDWPQQWSMADVRQLDGETQAREGFAVERREPYDSPWSTTTGREALVRAFRDAGAVHYPQTKTGALAMSSDALGDGTWIDHTGTAKPGMLKVYGDNPAVREICELLTQATGASAKYAEIQKYVVDGRVHPSIGAEQGSKRWAMVRPSVTNMGARGAAGEQRRALIADEGHVLLTCDLSQVDMRAMAALSQDASYMELFAPGRDAHMEMAEVYFGERTKEARQKTKAFNHAGNYGQGPRAVSERTGIPQEVCESIARVKAEAYPRLAEYIAEVRAQAASGSLLENGFGGFLRPDPERAYTQGPALVGQGAAREIMCESLLRLVDAHPGATQFLRAVVHDEVVLSVPGDETDLWQDRLREAFTWGWRSVPILCEVSNPGRSWADCEH